MTRRVLVTGSREWIDLDVLFKALLVQHGLARKVGVRLVVVHGAAGQGADAIAAKFCELAKPQAAIFEERHPANWDRQCDEKCTHAPRERAGKPNCPAAGPLRNQEMVDAGADVCLAFLTRWSRGTRDCVQRAEAAGIPVLRFEPKPREAVVGR